MNLLKISSFLYFVIICNFTFSQDSTYYSDMEDSLSVWVDIRIENVKKSKEKVIMPLAVRTIGWGCNCPNYYIGVNTNTQEGPWIEPKADKKFPHSDSVGYSLIVTGYFTGKWKVYDFRNKDGDGDYYKIPQFKIISWEENKKEYEAPMMIIK